MKRFPLILLYFIYVFSVSAQNIDTSYSFFVAGHTYGAPGVNNVGLHPKFADQFDYIKGRSEIEMGFLVGDVVFDPSELDWDEVDAHIDSLAIPVHIVPGNHDMRDRPLFISRYGSPYSSFSYRNDLFILLDPNEHGWSIIGDQLTFLQNTIQENKDSHENIFVFFHQVLWRESDNDFAYIKWNSSEGRVDPVNFWPDILPLFTALENDVFMFAGDIGVSWASKVVYDRYQNLHLIATGMGGTELDNYIIVNVDSTKEVDYDLICINSEQTNCLGELEDHQTITASIEPIQVSEFDVYPNPSSEQVYISKRTSTPITIQVFNTQGHLITSKLLTSAESNFTLPDLKPGLYTFFSSTPSGETKHTVMITE